MITTYKGYTILRKADIRDNVRSMFNVLTRCGECMVGPRMMHFVCEIEDFDIFPHKFVQAFKEKFESEWRVNERRRSLQSPTARTRVLPRIEMINSIEAKDINNPYFNEFDPDQPPKLRFNHIHIMLIVDVGSRLYGSKEITSISNRALNRIDGIRKLIIEDDFHITNDNGNSQNRGFLKFRDKNSTVRTHGEFLDYYWHDLKNEFADAVIRASYLCKSEQKSLLPARFSNNSFSVTRIPRTITTTV